MKNAFLVLLLCLGALGSGWAQEGQEWLFIFTQGKESPKVQALIQALTDSLVADGLPVKRIELKGQNALPEELTVTPMLIYQNHQGRAIYQGRYTTLNRVRNFVRLQRQHHIPAQAYHKARMLERDWDRGKIFVDAKITPIKGEALDEAATTAFLEQAWTGIRSALKAFTWRDTTLVPPTALKFYFDFHPYRGKDGKVYVSYDLFSHYDCINPIYSVSGAKAAKQAKPEKAFAQAASALEKALMSQLQKSELGDAYWALPAKTQKISWEEFGYPLPPRPRKDRKQVGDEVPKLAKSWILSEPGEAHAPMLNFHFPPPLQQYAGEVPGLRGELELGEDFKLEKAKGRFTVDLNSVTMGIPELDSALYKKMFLVDKFPTAELEFEGVTGDNGVLKWSRFNLVQIPAKLHFKGKTVEVLLPSQWEPVLKEDGQVYLHTKGFFKLDQLKEAFGLEQPPGPENANNSLVFHFDLLFRAK